MFPPYLGINWSVNFNKDVLLLTWTAVLAALGNWQVLVPLQPPPSVSRWATVHSIVLHYLAHYCGFQPTLGLGADIACTAHYLHLSSPVEHILSITPAQSTQLQPMEGWKVLNDKLLDCPVNCSLACFYPGSTLNFLPHIDRERERERGANGTDREL